MHFFTSMEEQTLDAVSGEHGGAIMFGLEFTPLSYITVGSAAGKFIARDKSQFDVEEINIYLIVNWQQSTTLEVMYANMDDKNTRESDHQFRAILTYRY